jgi:putative hydrolase of the HAD superfamily
MTRLAIVLDLDDTLYPERQFAHGGFRAAARWAAETFALTPQAEATLLDDMIASLDRGTLGALFGETLRTHCPKVGDDDLNAFIRAYGRASPPLALFPDARRLLDGPLGPCMCGLITDGHAPTQQKKITALDLDRPQWRNILTGALGPDRAFHKPHPRAFEMMAHNAEPTTRFVYVGDNISKDFVAPNALGWTTVHIVRRDLASAEQRIHASALGDPPAGGAPRITIDTLDALAAVLA